MILVYPMLTSSSVNQTILPGLIKTIEKYIIIHNTDDVIKHFNMLTSDIIKSGLTGAAYTGGAMAAAYVVTKLKDATKGGTTPVLRQKGKKLVLGEQKLPDRLKSAKMKVTQTAADIAAGAEKEIEKTKDSKKKPAITGFDMPKYDSVSLEPTWVQVHTSQGTKLIGVKVIPFRVSSTTGMVGLMMNDAQLKNMQLLANKYGRTVKRVFYRAMRGLKVPGFSGKPISGDPKRDIILAQTQYGKNTFICLSQLDIEQDEIFTSPQAVQKLHKLGWTSIIITDDVNKQATFCMQEFGGVCSTIPYSFIFSSLGKEHHQVYKDLEDAQRSAGPFFRRKSTTRRKIFSQK